MRDKITGLPLIEKNYNKYIKEIEMLSKLDRRVTLLQSQYIQKSSIDSGKTYNLIKNKKLCKGGIYYFTGNIMDACRNEIFHIKDIKKFKINDSLIFCNKTCPNQEFSLKIFKPKFLKKSK